LFRLQEDGWHLRGSGGEAFVNQQPIAGWTRIRSGDVVRMSSSGPDFSFGLVAGEDRRIPRAPREAEPAVLHAERKEHAAAIGQRAALASDEEPNVPSMATPIMSARTGSNLPWAKWVIAGLVFGILGIVLVRSVISPPTIVVNVGQPAAGTTPAGAPTVSPPLASDREGVPSEATRETESNRGAADKSAGAKQMRESADIAARLNGAVFLIQVEKAGRTWPYATCVAIADDTLLTTAREAAQLAAMQTNDGFKVWVTRPADGFKEEVQDLRVNGVYASLADKPNDWIYFDLGLLTVRGKLPKIAPLASREELMALEDGVPVACFGYPHEGDKVTRFDKFEPRLSQGKVYVITVSEELPGRPRLLHIKADIPKFAYGSPIVTRDGKVVGIYGEAAVSPADEPTGDSAPSDGQGLKDMHYAAVVNPEMINLWLHDRGGKMWLPAIAQRTSESTRNKP
jgi:hypothetical protein